MALAKNLLLLVVASSALVVICLGETTKLVVGDHQPGDYQEPVAKVEEDFKLIGKKVVIERWFNATQGRVITQVVATNEYPEGGAEVAVIGGGPGQNGVELRFKSERWHGVFYKVQLYSKPDYSAAYIGG